MNDYRKYTCPACNGKGCQLCQNKGTVVATSQQIQQAKSVIQQAVRKRQQQLKQNTPSISPLPSETKPKLQIAGLLATLVLLLLGGGASASYIYFKSFRPFFAGLTSLAIGIITKLLWNSPIIKSKIVNDFLTNIENA
ncbi:hypothetical protein KKD62_03010 [Patescibacteria group bacterium]|nr:hypothetical protein [Patescibacteria group bacterium]MBU1931502.1 hypothetical protein [Patescibacteria group bacterium]